MYADIIQENNLTHTK